MAMIGTIVVAMDPLCDGSYNRIGKILAIVDRPNIYYGGIQQIALVRLQHNGSHYIIPHSKLREATSEEKSQDKIIQLTWSKQDTYLDLSKVYWVEKPAFVVPCSVF